jgi:hypothetical protein
MGDKLRAINWLQYYGISRMLGSAPAEAAGICNMVPEDSAVAFDAVLESSKQMESIRDVGAQAAISTIGSVVGAVPVIGTIGSILVQGVGWVVKLVAKSQAWGCNKGCKTYDPRNLITLCPPPIGKWQSDMDYLTWTMHDGLVADGLGAPDSAQALGRHIGVYARHEPHCDKGAREKAYEKDEEIRRRKNIEGMVRVKGTATLQVCSYAGAADIPKGNASAPWKDKGNNWYWRAWQVRCLMRWLEWKMPCNVLMCVGDTMRQLYKGTLYALAGGTKYDKTKLCKNRGPALKFAKETGSRWYASIFYMHKDIWNLAQQLSVEEVERVANEHGCQEFATAYKAYVSRSWTAEQLAKEPWPGFSPTSTLSWKCAQEMIPALSQAVMANLPRAIWSPEKRAQIMRLATSLRRPAAQQVRVPAHMATIVRIMRQDRLEAERKEKWVKYGVPIGIGVFLIAGGAALYWYMTKDEQEPVPNLPPWDGEDEHEEWE